MGLVLGGIVTSEFGWEVPFYAHASAATVWFIFYIFLVYSSPDEHPRISEVNIEIINPSNTLVYVHN